MIAVEAILSQDDMVHQEKSHHLARLGYLLREHIVRRTFAEEKEIMTDGYHSHTGKALGADKADKEKAFCLYPDV